MIQTKDLEKLFSKKTTDYTFTIIFFVIFSFFVFFVIRPTLLNIFRLQKEVEELQMLDTEYEKAIFTIISIQSQLEKNREFFPLLNTAMPSMPQVNQVIDDVKKIASESGIEMKKLDINQINLKTTKTKSSIKPYSVSIETTSDFNTANKFIANLLKQRRLKTLKQLSIVREVAKKEEVIGTDSAQLAQATGSAKLKIQFEIEVYYL